jgi:DNA-directed RNA polymerase specialized sigma subunit
MNSVRRTKSDEAVSSLKDYLLNCRLLFVKMIQSPFYLESDRIKMDKKHFHLIDPSESDILLNLHEKIEALNTDEQIIIFYKFLVKKELMDFEIQNLLAISERTYYRKKKQGLTKLAIALRFLKLNFTAK